MIGDLFQDVRFAVRGLARKPGFTVVALVILAVGIGGNTALFSVVRSVLLRPLPFEAPEELVQVRGRDLETGNVGNLSPADFMDFQNEATSLARMGANGWIGPATSVGADGSAERIGEVQVTEGFFRTLRVSPAMGRLFTPDEDLPGSDPVAILSDGLWRQSFGADPGIVGRSILLDAVPTTVIGVLPPSYRHIEERTDRSAQIFTTHRFERGDPNRGGHYIRAVARLAPGRSVEAAQSELASIAARLEALHPESNTDQGVAVTPLHDAVVGAAPSILWMLLGATGLVLLVVCANLANLLLASGAGRRKELALRSALGAGRARLVRQLVTESLVLGVTGGALGVLIAVAASGPLSGISAAGIPRAGDVGVDGVVLGFAVVTTLLTSVGFGLVPALLLTPGKLSGRLGGDGARGRGGSVRRSSRKILISAEVAVAVVLVVGASLLAESVWHLQREPVGFEPSRAVAMEVAPPPVRYPDDSQIAFQSAFEQRVEGIPGVVEAGSVNILPLTANFDGRGFQVENDPRPRGRGPSAQARSVTPGYFRAMGIPLVRGRLLSDADREGAPLVVVVSRSLAERHWPGEDPVGQRITFNGGIPDEEAVAVGGPGSREVVGVVGDVKHLEVGADAVPTFYTPQAQPPSYHTMTLVVRAGTDTEDIVPTIREELAALDPNVPLSQVRSLEGVVTGSVAGTRLQATLLALFAVTGLLLAAIGVYGVIGYLVRRRTHEIGVRIALGARRGEVVRMFVIEGMRPIALGLVAGVLGAVALSGILRSALYGISPLDASTYLFASVVIVAAGLAATIVPARRAVAAGSAAALREP